MSEDPWFLKDRDAEQEPVPAEPGEALHDDRFVGGCFFSLVLSVVSIACSVQYSEPWLLAILPLVLVLVTFVGKLGVPKPIIQGLWVGFTFVAGIALLLAAARYGLLSNMKGPWN